MIRILTPKFNRLVSWGGTSHSIGTIATLPQTNKAHPCHRNSTEVIGVTRMGRRFQIADFRFKIFNLQSQIYNLKCPAGASSRPRKERVPERKPSHSRV